MLLVLIASLALGACYSVRYTSNKRADGPEQSRTNHFFLLGLVGHPRVDLGAICPHGIATAEVIHTFGDQFLAAITFFLWTPTTTRYRCAVPDTQASRSPGLDETTGDIPSPQTALITRAEGR